MPVRLLIPLTISLLALVAGGLEPLLARADGAAGGPAGRAIANLDSAGCRELLQRLEVPARPYQGEAEGVRDPFLLTGRLGGVSFEHHGRREVHAVLDCRLILALRAWAPTLREAGIRGIRHISVYRAGSRVETTGRRSGHAAGLAIDVRYVELDDGTTLDVLDAWEDRRRGAMPCDPRPDEGPPGSLLRSVVCAAVAADLFQTTVTPHHNAAHANHVHLELVPGVDWTWAR